FFRKYLSALTLIREQRWICRPFLPSGACNRRARKTSWGGRPRAARRRTAPTGAAYWTRVGHGRNKPRKRVQISALQKRIASAERIARGRQHPPTGRPKCLMASRRH